MSQTPTALLRDELVSRAAQQGKLKPFPANALKLVQLGRDPNCSIADIEEVIEREPAILAQILAVANSPLFGYSRQVDSVSHAIVILGIKRVTQLAVTFAAGSLYADDQLDPERSRSLYQRSLGCALLAREIAQQEAEVDSGDAFLHGLLHDIGKLIMHSIIPDYAPEQVPMEELIVFETVNYGVNHQEIGSICARQWGFPSSIVQTISDHHGGPNQPLNQSLATVIEAANWVAHSAGIGMQPRDDVRETCTWNTLVCDLAPDRQETLVDTASRELQHLTSIS